VTPQEIKTNLLSGLTVALALVPEAIAFALVAHVDPLVGLYAALIISFVTSLFGGRPGMISGATGALAVVAVALVVEHGVQYLFAAVVLMGILQIVFGLAGLIALTVGIIYLLPRLTKAVPATLVGIVAVSGLVFALGLDTRTVGDMASIAGGLPKFSIPMVPFSLETLRIILPYSMIMAAVGLIETLLTLNLIDTMTDTRGRPNKECLAQGAANVVTGLFGGMGGCAMIGQSMINVNNGALRRLSGLSAAVFLLSFILFGSPLIERIPLAALVGVMVVVAEKTFEWGSIRSLRSIPRADALIVIGVTVVTVMTDLAIAVIAGVIIAALVFAWEHAKHINVTAYDDANGWRVYELEGSLFFASAGEFQTLFAPKDDPQDVVVEFKRARVVDHSALEAIDALASRYVAEGKRLHLRHLSPDCLELLDKAKGMMEVNVLEDPRYHVADDKLA